MISSIGASLIMVSIAEAVFGVSTRRFPDAGAGPAALLHRRPRRGAREPRADPHRRRRPSFSRRPWASSSGARAWARPSGPSRPTTKAARLLGIDVDAVVVVTFLVAGALAGAAGILVGLLTNNIVPGMGAQIELRGLAVVILGGMGNIEGAVLGGLILGLVETFAIAYVPGAASIKDAIAFLILFLILLVRPNGILGRARAERRMSARETPLRSSLARRGRAIVAADALLVCAATRGTWIGCSSTPSSP